MKTPDPRIAGVFQFFYHCAGQKLPVRDVLNTQRQGRKTEPHYENLTENWCRKCMNGRMRSANRREVKYLFLMTRYFNEGHPRNGKLLVVGFLYRAKEKIWRKLSKSIQSGASAFDPENPQECGFFAGDEAKSHFVSADDAYVLKDVKNGRWKFLATEKETEQICLHLRKAKKILKRLRDKVKELELQSKRHGYGKNRQQCAGC